MLMNYVNVKLSGHLIIFQGRQNRNPKPSCQGILSLKGGYSAMVNLLTIKLTHAVGGSH